ncbi:MAG TPA: GspH/FimT family pseudopilin [Rhodanobacteraceae bacterium]|nr:GspH/FimT family pseudopilin [Rhodanobacteraceae bacterium]
MDASRTAAGMTLVELVTVIAIAAIVLMLGAPAFGKLKAQVQTRTAEGQVTRALQHARHAAIMRGTRVLMCPSVDGKSCTSGFAWHSGWIIALDADHDGKPDTGTPVLAMTGAVASNLRLITSVGREKIVFHPDGSAPGSNTTFTICQGTQALGATVIVSNVGRVRSAAANAAQLEKCIATAP